MSERQIYVDNNATTKPLLSVAKACLTTMGEDFGNPSSPHERGRRTQTRLQAAREQVANLAGTESDSVTFLSGATEANNAVLGDLLSSLDRCLITTAAEHPSVKERVEKNTPERLIEVELDEGGRVHLGYLKEAAGECHNALIALQWVNGETGVIQPVDEICAIARDYGAQVLLDASQAIGRLEINPPGPDCTWMTFSAHKIHGPQGIGALISNPPAKAPVLLYGGSQENGRRAGTENLPGILGFAEACRQRSESLHDHLQRMRSLRDLFESQITGRLDFAWVNGADSPRVPNTSNIAFKGVDGMALAARADSRGVMCSQVSACSSAKPEPSRALLEMGLSEEDAFSSLRFSFSILNTVEEVNEAARIIAEEAERIIGGKPAEMGEFMGAVQ